MRVVIATRVFSPEVSAASAILRTWAEEFEAQGHEVEVFTVKPPRGLQHDDPPGVTVRRARVKRDKQQYVRGYLSYMSFDLPLAFRLLFSQRPDIYIVEPPPTTVAVVRVVAAIRRRPYAVRAADYWTDAAELVVRSKFVINVLKRVEAWGLQGAAVLFAAHEPLVGRFREAGVTSPAIPIGFGADTRTFHYEGQAPPMTPVFVYAGTHASWHGAGIFIEALARIVGRFPSTRLVYYGTGEERESMIARVAELGLEHNVDFHAPIPPAILAPILASATASVASLAPVAANAYAVATKVYAALACGCPVIFTGVGPTDELLASFSSNFAGVAVPYDIDAVAEAMLTAASHPLTPRDREQLAEEATARHSLKAIATVVVQEAARVAHSS
jgi:glycosyltransferase involved in cell wall biosynthesis